MNYDTILQRKLPKPAAVGVECEPSDLPGVLFEHQRLVTAWAARQGRAALFLDTGLGKTACQVAWINHLAPTSGLIVAPLCVAQQTIAEARALLGVEIEYLREPSGNPGLHITNYEHVHKFVGAEYTAVALDESSILKGIAGKTRKLLTDGFANTPYRLCCTATPAPNDVTELANHAEFLGVMTIAETMANFFVNENGQGKWRLKRHAHEAFFEWLASWSVALKSPSDLGLDGSAYELPPLEIEESIVQWEYVRSGELFGDQLNGIQDRTRARRETSEPRVERAAEIVLKSKGPWVVWCGLNDESTAITKALEEAGDSVVEVSGSMPSEDKEAAIGRFLAGEVRVLVTKPKIAGFGMNFQHCSQTLFLGLSDSYEAYYQAIRRFWRFGQKKSVRAVIVTTSAEEAVVENVRRKESEARETTRQLVSRCKTHIHKNLLGKDRGVMESYKQSSKRGNEWEMVNGDCYEVMRGMDDESVDLSVFSPPFISLYTYTDSPRDMGNCTDADTFFDQFRFALAELLRITKQGRIAACHVAQVPAMLGKDGYIGIKDFRGNCIRAAEAEGWIYHGEVTVDKDPQAQAIRTKSKSLLFTQGKKDSSWLRPALADYILVFRKSGDPVEKINSLRDTKTNPNGWISADEWIEWARPIWYGIKEGNTLNVAEARGEDDERHICPLQLETIHRCVMLWSKPGETVFSPFAGIGSEGYQAIRDGRKFLGVELKREYFDVACRNLKRAEREAASEKKNLFESMAGGAS